MKVFQLKSKSQLLVGSTRMKIYKEEEEVDDDYIL